MGYRRFTHTTSFSAGMLPLDFVNDELKFTNFFDDWYLLFSVVILLCFLGQYKQYFWLYIRIIFGWFLKVKVSNLNN